MKLEDSLKDALKEVAMASDRQRSLEQECSQMKLLHLATTAELEQTKTALEKANEDSSEIHTLRLVISIRPEWLKESSIVNHLYLEYLTIFELSEV